MKAPRWMDRWDVFALASAATLGAGVSGQWGWTWTAMLFGVMGLALYVAREVRQ